MITKTELQAVLEEMRAGDRKRRVEPPTVEEMIAYRDGALSPDEEERVRELLICWPELLRALMTPYPDDDASALPAEVVERQWKAMRSEIGGRVVAFRNALTALAAALAVVFAGLYWQARLELRRPRTLQPQTLMSDTQRGSGDGPTVLESHGDDYLLSPVLISEQSFERYRFELADAGHPERIAWNSGAVRRGDDGTFAVLVPRAFLAPGRYTLVLYGVNGGRSEKLETYTVLVR